MSQWGCACELLFVERSNLNHIIELPQGCVHFRHPYELGGAAYCSSMLWAQMMPFVALGWYEGGKKEQLKMWLLGCFGVWVALNGLFFLSIERSFVRTFFTRKTAPQYTVELFLEATSDELRFDAAFTNRRSYIEGVKEQVKEWMGLKVVRFQVEDLEWWEIEMVGDEFLPEAVIEAVGGVSRRNSLGSIEDIFNQ